jgi:putative DNA primase/helicase
VWRAYRPGDGQSAYLAEKGVKAHGLRWAPADNGTFAVPMMDAKGQVHGLQIIRDAKREGKLQKEYFPRGLAKKGKYHTLGTIRDLVLIAEGYATGATLFEATGLPVVIAFDAGNLQPVAEAIHKAYPRVQILVCADDDYLTDGNPGVAAATNAALAVGGAWVKPEFITDRAGKKLTDFNDLANLDGAQQVQACIQAAVAKMPQTRGATPLLARGSTPQGGGDGAVPGLLCLEDAAERYSIVYGGKGTLFDHVDHTLVPKQDVLDIAADKFWRSWKEEAGRGTLSRRVVRINEVGFDPTGTDKTIKCNLWKEWPRLPAPAGHAQEGEYIQAGSVTTGSCQRWLDLLRFLCAMEDNEEAVFHWVLCWLAYPIKHPGAKMKTALIFHGPQGAGKNLIFESVMALYGEYGRIVDQSAIEDKFNDWASKKCFLIGDEVVARQELFHQKNKLKALITGDTIRINPKNVSAHEERNHVNIVFLSNERQPLVLEPWDRRYTVVWTPDKLDERIYRECADEMRHGGLHALYNYLRDYDIGDFNPHSKPIYTQAKQDLIDVSLDSTERFVRDWENGETEWPFCPAASMDVFAAYLKWCARNGVSRPRESNQFIAHFTKLWAKSTGPKHHYETTHYAGKTRQTRMIVPPGHCLEARGTQQPMDKGNAEWLTDCLFRFKDALGGGQ